MDPDSFYRIFNYAEAGLWAVIGVAFLMAFFRRRGRRTLLPAFLFLAFGATDIVEVYTGAWWRPISLLVAKAGIVAVLLLCLIAHIRHSKRARSQGTKVA